MFPGLKPVVLVVCILHAVQTFCQPGSSGDFTVTSSGASVNRFAIVTTSLTAGTTSVPFTAMSGFSVCPGDLLMIYQAQGATMNGANNSGYGSIINYNSAGCYEFAYVQNINGATVTLQGILTHSYSQYRTQLVKVPMYNNLTIQQGAKMLARNWKDTIINSVPMRYGGLVVIHANQIINHGVISASGAGFRGGAQDLQTAFATGITSFASSVSSAGAEKGESIAGYQADYDNNGGRYCFGAPANGGGGGNAHNAAGGGGANGNNGNIWTGQGVMVSNSANPLSAWALSGGYINNGNALTNSSGGGHGGYSWSNTNLNATIAGPNNNSWQGDARREVGGLGGRPPGNINPDDRIYFGGGGGAAEANNNVTPGGGNGGGIVYLISLSGISGSGQILSDGNNALNVFGSQNDAGSGAGAGGTIIIKGTVASTQLLSAHGGTGASQGQPSSPAVPDEADGPGGGGGGGVIAISGGTPVIDITGGLNGSTASQAMTEFPYNGSTKGANGQSATISSAFISYMPISQNLAIVASANTVCAGSSVTLTASGSANYSWVPGGASGAVLVASPTVSQTYSVYGFTANGCIAASGSIHISVHPGSFVSVTPPSGMLCAGQTLTLHASGAQTYTWMPGSLFGPVLAISPAASVVYTVTGTDAAGCSATSATASVLMVSSLNLSITPSATAICPGGTATLTASGGSNYFWQPLNLAAPGVTVNPFTTMAYTVSAAGTTNCPVNDATITVVVYPYPQIMVYAASSVICQGNIVTLNGSGAVTYTWIPGNLSGATQTMQPTSNTVYQVNGTNINGCESFTTIAIIVEPCMSVHDNNLPLPVVFPVPADDIITIMFSESGILEVTDCWGLNVLQQQLVTGKNEISIAHLQSGIYFARLHREDKPVITIRFVRN